MDAEAVAEAVAGLFSTCLLLMPQGKAESFLMWWHLLAARQTTMMSKVAHVITALYIVYEQVNILCYAYCDDMKSCSMLCAA